MKSKLKILKLIFLLCLIIASCEKDDTEINSIHKEKINPASVDDAKSFFNVNYRPSNNDSRTLQKSTNTLQVDWQSSKTKEYKETSTQDVDILYTPIYINTNANAKAFVATVDNNGITESKIFLVLYKENPFGSLGLSAYIFRYAIDGTVEIGYNLENGIQVPFDTSTTSSSNKSNSNCDEYPSSGDFDEVQQWLEDCNGILDEVKVEAPTTPLQTIDVGSSSGGGCLDCSSWPGFDSSLFNDNSTSAGTSVNPNVVIPNLVSADPISIAIALEAPLLSQEYAWLNNLPTNEQTQQLLEAIAQFLNDNKAKSPDPAFDNTNPSQIPSIKDSAINFVMNYINFMINNPNSGFIIDNTVDLENAMSFSSFQDAENYFNSLSNNNATLVSSVNEAGSLRTDVIKLEYSSFPQADFVTTIKAEIPDANNALECMQILNARTKLEGNISLFDWTQYGSENPADNDGPTVTIDESWDRLSVVIEGELNVGLNLDGNPARIRHLYSIRIMYQYSTSDLLNDSCYWYDTSN
jgi:hypothetical protein